MPRLPAVFLWALLALGLLGLPAAGQVAASNIEAKLLLSRAREAQMPGWDRAGRKPLEISSFRGRFRVRLYDYADPAKPKETDGTLTQYWQSRTLTRGKKKGQRQTRYRRDLGSDATKDVLVLTSDWDDFCWRRKDKGKKPGKIVPLNKKADEAERKKLADEKRRVDQLFRIFLLATLPIDARTAKMGPVRGRKLTLSFGRNEFTSVCDEVRFSDQNGHRYELWIDNENFRPVMARIRFKGAKGWERFTMAQHFEVSLGTDASQRLIVPCNVVYHDAANRPVLMLSTDRPQEAFGFNVLEKMDKKALRKLFPFIE